MVPGRMLAEVRGGVHRSGGEDQTWSGSGWTVSVSDTLLLETHDDRLTVTATDAVALDVRRRWFRWGLYQNGHRLAGLDGLSGRDAASLRRAVRKFALSSELGAADEWAADIESRFAALMAAHRWIPTETVDGLIASRPPQGLGARVEAAGCTDLLSEYERRAITAVDGDLRSLVAALNREIVEAGLEARREFFDTIESSPLTDEQAMAVMCFDNRVQVRAAAGSGKTSVMVARAAYAVDRGIVPPDRILLLAFNKAAAVELQERVQDRFAAAGIDSTGVRASTFHSFGLDVIGAATGLKPRLASWLDDDNGVGEVLRIVDSLRDASPVFRYEWDLYRLLYSGASTDLDGGEPDGWDPDSRTTGYQTYAGEVVRSHGERLIADFLYLSGVEYRYEQPYAFDVADAQHSQYRPDFYYPGIDVWHEHWAVDRDGNPPAEFVGYAESMIWKRELHKHFGTTLIETTFDEVVNGDGLVRLQSVLEEHGVTFDWNPNRPVNKWVRPMDDTAMARLVRTFMAHVKSNSLTHSDIEARLRTSPNVAAVRTRLFLRIYWQIHDEWQRRLVADGSVDFEDMLVSAAEHLEAGHDPGFDLVLVDEFQDASQARARLVRALVSRPNRYLFAVGDDWQAINRFAGSDLSVMTRFDEWFGRSTQLALTTTFRCPQTICDVASRFVSKNPEQFDKAMHSAQSGPGTPVRVVFDDDPRRAVAAVLSRLSAAVTPGTVPQGRNGEVTVDVLGRYGFQRDLVGRTPSNLTVRFRTVHSSKGLEADHIIVVGLDTTRYGFPSGIADDPVLDLAMPIPEAFPHAEERRLFYVALTRARRDVTVVAPPVRMSPFVSEIIDDPNVVIETIDGAPASRPIVCSQCGTGTMTRRVNSRTKQPFLGCTNFPACRNTQRLDQ